jgi:hypothetical protein
MMIDRKFGKRMPPVEKSRLQLGTEWIETGPPGKHLQAMQIDVPLGWILQLRLFSPPARMDVMESQAANPLI